MQACVKETMRLHPLAFPVRIASKATTIQGRRVPAGSLVHAATYAMHRDPRVWSDADDYQPQRFIDGLSPAAEAAYHPFGAGPRSCVGCAPLPPSSACACRWCMHVWVRVRPVTRCTPAMGRARHGRASAGAVVRAPASANPHAPARYAATPEARAGLPACILNSEAVRQHQCSPCGQ